MVIVLDFRSEGQWFDTQSLPSCCFLRQETLPHMSLSTQVYKMGTGDILLGVVLLWTTIPSRGEKKYSQLLHATETRLSSGRVGLLGSYAT